MATHKSARKAARQALKRNARNTAALSECRTVVKKVRAALTAKADATAVKELISQAQSVLMSNARKGILKAETAARYVSRLSRAAHQQSA